MSYISMVELLILVSIGLYTDIKYYKIKNSLVVSFVIIGIITNLILNGTQGVVMSLIGIVFPFVIFLLLFAIRAMGAGDIKMFMAIGSVLGFYGLLENLVFSFAVGGVISIALMIKRRNFLQRIMYFIRYIKILILGRRLNKYSDLKPNDDSNFRFGYAIAIGSYIQITLYLLNIKLF